jgi:hypothetical protein
VRVGRWTLRQGGGVYRAAVIGLMLALLVGACAIMPRTLVLAAVLLRAAVGLWLPLLLPAALLPFVALHEASHLAAFRAAGLPVRLHVRWRFPPTVAVEVPVAVPRRVALLAALSPQPVVLGALAALSRAAPALWPLCLLLALLSVAGSSADFLAAAALALSRDEAVGLR